MAAPPGWVSFDLDRPEPRAVDVRAARVVAVESDATEKNVVRLRIAPDIYYRVIGEVDEVLADLAAATCAEIVLHTAAGRSGLSDD